MSSTWAPIPERDWAARVRICRERGTGMGWDQPGRPLSDYEPCEKCGVRVVAMLHPDGRKGWAELARLDGAPDGKGARLRLDGRWHSCRGRS